MEKYLNLHKNILLEEKKNFDRNSSLVQNTFSNILFNATAFTS